MKLFARVFGSSLGKKYVMATTGALLFAFVVLHLVGNLQIFLGAEQLNRYGAFLQSALELVWPARIGLIVLVLLHIGAAISLSLENRRARPVPYANYKVVAASYASRTMFMSGIIILVFIIYHLLHFTVQVPALNFIGRTASLPTGSFIDLHDAKERHDVYQMMVLGFSRPLVSGFYILGMALLALHLSHGLSAMFQSMGWRRRPYTQFLDGFARILAWLIFLGYSLIPAAILLGYGRK